MEVGLFTYSFCLKFSLNIVDVISLINKALSKGNFWSIC